MSHLPADFRACVKEVKFVEKCYDLKCVRHLGKGSYGEVKLYVDRKTRKKVAVKQMCKNLIDKSMMDPQDREMLMEVLVIKSLQHKNIIEYRNHFKTRKSIFIVMEYAEGVLLSSPIQEKKVTGEKLASYIFKQLLNGVAYLHENGFAHMDIKPQNTMLCRSGNVRIIDFGASVRITTVLRHKKGTRRYTSPEALVEQPRFRPTPCDIWALGCTLFKILTRQVPFRDPEEIISKECVIPNGFSKECHEIITAMLNKEIESRPTSESLKSYSWIKKYLYKPSKITWKNYISFEPLDPEESKVKDTSKNGEKDLQVKAT